MRSPHDGEWVGVHVFVCACARNNVASVSNHLFPSFTSFQIIIPTGCTTEDICYLMNAELFICVMISKFFVSSLYNHFYQ